MGATIQNKMRLQKYDVYTTKETLSLRGERRMRQQQRERDKKNNK